MSMQINTFEDILRALDADPQLKERLREHILTEEMLRLPATVEAMRGDIYRIDGRLDGIDGRLDGIDGRLDRMDGRLDRMEGRQDRMDGRLGYIAGGQYENRAAHRVVSRVQSLGIERARLVLATGESRPSFRDAMADAVSSGLITQAELDDLTSADIVLRGGNHRHAVIEASLGPDRDDLERALRRAAILARATGDQVTAAVAAPEPSAEISNQAENLGIAVLIIAE